PAVPPPPAPPGAPGETPPPDATPGPAPPAPAGAPESPAEPGAPAEPPPVPPPAPMPAAPPEPSPPPEPTTTAPPIVTPPSSTAAGSVAVPADDAGRDRAAAARAPRSTFGPELFAGPNVRLDGAGPQFSESEPVDLLFGLGLWYAPSERFAFGLGVQRTGLGGERTAAVEPGYSA